jgi:hypothetical protein
MNIYDAWNSFSTKTSDPSTSNINIANLEKYINKRKTKFTYIANDELTKSLDDIKEDNELLKKSRIFNVNLCFYTICQDCYIEIKQNVTTNDDEENENYLDIPSSKQNDFFPFVMILLDNGNFPIIQHEILEYSPNVDNDDNSPEQISFETDCFIKLNDIMNNSIHDIIKDMESIKKLYKGFVESEDNKHEIFAFFDITPFQYKPLESSLFYWVIMDEILYKKKVFSIPISPNVTQFFKINKHMRYVKNEDGEEYPLPHQLYICKKNTNYNNLLKTEVEQNGIITIDNNEMCNAFYFTSEAINYVFINGLQRFACFIINCVYIDDILNVDNELILGASTIYFHDENKLQLWCVKNITQFTIIP